MLNIDYRDSRPIYEQVADGFEHMVMCGVLEPEYQMPSVRQLAMELSINPNTIQKAYAELERRGVVYSVKGRGSFVSSEAKDLKRKRLDKIKAQMIEIANEAIELGTDVSVLIDWLEEGTKGGKK